MKATTQTKAPATPAELPSFQQFVALAIAKAESDLEFVCRIRCSDKDWTEEDVDVDTAVDLALDQIRRMKTVQFADCDAFTAEWIKVASVLNLGARSFSRKDCSYMRFLDGACHMFAHAAEMAEFIRPD